MMGSAHLSMFVSYMVENKVHAESSRPELFNDRQFVLDHHHHRYLSM